MGIHFEIMVVHRYNELIGQECPFISFHMIPV